MWDRTSPSNRAGECRAGRVSSWETPTPHSAAGGAAAAPQSRSRGALSWNCTGDRADRHILGCRRTQLLQMGKYRKADVPAAHLRSMPLFPSLPGTWTRGIWVLDLLHMSLSPQVSLVLWPRAQVGLAQGRHYPLFPGILVPNGPWLQTISLLHFLSVELSHPFFCP